MAAKKGNTLKNDIVVEICPAIKLSDEEKSALSPDLKRRGLNPGMLDIITNIPNRTRIIKARSEEGKLLAITSILITPTMFMKHFFGEGNHIGTNNTFYFADTGHKAEILAAIFKKLRDLRFFGYYVGIIDELIMEDFLSALKKTPHVVAQRVMERGSIATCNPDSEERLFENHKHLIRQVNRFQNKGGTIHLQEGPVGEELADKFVLCCTESYKVHSHPGRPIDVEGYGSYVRDFLTSFPGILHIYAKLNGRVVGVQTFIRHDNHLELSEGGFLRGEKTYHAYENIIVASVRYAAKHGLEKVGYGLISNFAKNRLMDKHSRTPVFLVMFFRWRIAAALCGPYRHFAHKRFPMPFWQKRNGFSRLSI